MPTMYGLTPYSEAPPQDPDIIRRQLAFWEVDRAPHMRWASAATECTNFLEGNQWSPEDKQLLLDEGRPALVYNKIKPLVFLLMGYFRQNQYDIRYMPSSDGYSDQDVAELLNALSKQTDEMNSSLFKDAQVFNDGLVTGRGFMDCRLDFDSNRLGEVTERVLDPFSVYIDAEANTYDPNDAMGWNRATYSEWMSLEEIFQCYGWHPADLLMIAGQSGMPIVNDRYRDGVFDEISPQRFFGMDDAFTRSDIFPGYSAMVDGQTSINDHVNRQRRLLRVMSTQHKMVRRVRVLLDVDTGDEQMVPDTLSQEELGLWIQLAQQKGRRYKIVPDIRKAIRWTVTCADKILWDDWSPYDRFTIQPYFGYFRRGKTRGMVEDLLDPQREVNKRMSAMLHILMTTANSGWLYEEGALEEEYEIALEREGSRPGINVKYNKGFQPPQRIQAAAPPSGFREIVMQNENMLKETAGISDSALGFTERVQSGRAILARQRQSVVGAEVYFSNFAEYRRCKGQMRLDLYQQFYSEQRLVRIRGDSGAGMEDRVVTLNAAEDLKSNIGIGKYVVAVEEAPASATFEQAQFDDAMALVEKGIQIPPDILIRLSSLPYKAEIVQRLKDQQAYQQTVQNIQLMGMEGQMGMQPGQPVPSPALTDPQQQIDPATGQPKPSRVQPPPPMQLPPAVGEAGMDQQGVDDQGFSQMVGNDPIFQLMSAGAGSDSGALAALAGSGDQGYMAGQLGEGDGMDVAAGMMGGNPLQRVSVLSAGRNYGP